MGQARLLYLLHEYFKNIDILLINDYDMTEV